MSRYELRLYMGNGCGQALLGEVATIEAPDASTATAQARERVRALPKHCFGTLHDPAGVEIWSGEAPSAARSAAG
jgi:hypothetical protein